MIAAGKQYPQQADLDITDRQITHSYVEKLRPDAIIHCAANVEYGGVSNKGTPPFSEIVQAMESITLKSINEDYHQGVEVVGGMSVCGGSVADGYRDCYSRSRSISSRVAVSTLINSLTDLL